MDRDWRSLVSFSLLSLALSSLNLTAKAQITPDSTLGGESSVVTPINPHFERIDGGAIRGSNLFHSFLEFSIREGHSAYFANPEAIQTIFSRVTGSNPSQLFGKLGVLGNANLFFINPNGIIFGPNASLDIRGSFVASTANSIVFPDGNKFSATNSQGVPLLTINVPVTVGLQFEGDSSGTIINAGDLAVGKNLALIGGTIVSTGQLSALNGEISLSTIAEGVVKLDEAGKVLGKEIQASLFSSQDGKELGLFLSGLVAENGGITGLMINSDGQVTLGDSQTAVKVGDIVVAGSSEKVSLQAQTAKLSAEKDLTLLGSQMGTVGEMTLLAQDTVRIRDRVANPLVVAAGEKLEVRGNQQVDIFALNHPDSELVSGGDMVLKSASEVIGDAHFWSGGSFRVEKLDGSLGDLVSPNDPIIRSQGDVSFFAYQGSSLHILAGGAVNINTVIITGTDTVGDTINPTATPSLANVTLSDGSSLVINGNAKPTLDIRAGMKREAIGSPLGTIGANSFSDVFFDSSLSQVSPPRNNTKLTNADITIGDVMIDAPNGLVYITNQFQPNLSLVSGNITLNGNGLLGMLLGRIAGINATVVDGDGSDVILDARGNITLNGSFIDTSSMSGNNNAGNVTLLAKDDINLNTGSSIFAAAYSSEGQGGNINIKTEHLLVDRAVIWTVATGEGNAGNLKIIASNSVQILGNLVDNTKTSILATTTSGKGNAGELFIETNKFLIQDGAIITTSARGTGNAGDLKITVLDSVQVLTNSMLLVSTYATGDAGDIIINTRELLVKDEGLISSRTFDTGNGGDITINTNKLLVYNDGIVSAGTRGAGNAGNLTVNASQLIEVDGTSLENKTFSGLETTSTGSGNAGNLKLTTQNLIVKNGGVIFTTTAGSGNAGDLIINASESVQVTGTSTDGQIPSSLRTENHRGIGVAGDLIVNTARLLVDGGARITANTRGQADAGKINLQVSESVLLSNDGQITSQIEKGAEGNSAGITLNTPILSITDNSQISAATAGKGSAGNIKIENAQSVSLANNSTISTAIETTGIATQPSNIDIQTRQLTLNNDSEITASTSGKGDAGSITVPTADSISLNGNSTISTAVENSAKGEGGDITIQTEKLALDNQSRLRASSAGEGNAGDININANNSISLNNRSQIASAAETKSAGDGGDINLKTSSLNLSNNSQITTSSQGQPIADAGKIELQANQITLTNNSQIAATTAAGKGGSISATANSLNLNNGSQIRTTTSGNNNAGDITLKIEESISLIGKNSGIFADTDLNSSGNGGKIFIDPHTFTIRDSAAVSVSSQGKGTGGNIEIHADFLTLDNGKIAAQTSSTTGGNITLRVSEVLWLKNGSQISTTAGTARGGGDGGNIDINAAFIFSNLYENNDITANAFTGKGGNIRVTAQGILGLVIADRLTRFSDITASSEFGLDGNIIINTAGIDPTRGLDKLKSETVNPKIDQGCQAIGGGTNAEFYNLGRGGLPENADDFFSEDLAGTWIPWVEPVSDNNINFTTQIRDKSSNGKITIYLILPCQSYRQQ